MVPRPEIEAAIRHTGSQPKLAALTGLSQQHISKLLRGERGISAEVAIAIERATESKVQRWHLRPDLWDAPANGGVAA